jgi:hypothetical protein
LREGISAQLLAQAAAELQVAAELLQVTEGEEGAGRTTRAAGGVGLSQAIGALERAMAVPVADGLAPFVPARRDVWIAPTDPVQALKEAKGKLSTAATTTTDAIVANVCEFGGDVAFDLIFNTKWTAVLEGAGLVRKDIAKKLDTLREGAGALFSRAVTVATKTLLNVYDKIMALLGKDVEDTARKQVRAWLDQIKDAGKVDLFEKLVSQLYALDAFKGALGGWIDKTPAGSDAIAATSGQVTKVGDRFTVLVGRMKFVEDAVGLGKLLQFPQALIIIAAIQFLLLAVLVEMGNDYVGYRVIKPLNLTKGVGEVLPANLGA